MSKSKLESLATEWEGRAREYRKQTETLLPNRAGNREGESLLWRARAYETCAEELRAALERPRPALPHDATDFIRREWINTGVEEYAGAIRDDGVTHDEALRLAFAAVLYMVGKEYAALDGDFRTSETIRLRQRAELDAALRGPALPRSPGAEKVGGGAALPPQTGNQP